MELAMKKLFGLKKHLPFGLATLAAVFLLSTGFERNQINPLTSAASQLLPSFALNDSRVVIAAKVMTSADSKRNFGHDLTSRGVKPLHLTIQNNTSNAYALCPSSVDLPRVSARKIASKITRSTLGRSIGYKIAGFFFWPFMIPGTIDGIRVMAHHKKIKKDFDAKSMKDEIVAPYTTYNRVLFVPEDKFKESFKVTLIDLDSLRPTEFQTTVEHAEKATEPAPEE
jgi:hypothetical protein